MTADELERLLTVALREGDRLPVDVAGGRAVLVRRELGYRARARQRLVVTLAAAACALLVVATYLLGAQGPSERRLQPAPQITLSPSGLPVGLLEGKVFRSSGRIAVTTVRLRVRADDSGTFAAGGGLASWGTYAVRWTPLGPGRVAMSYEGPVCSDPQALVLDFRVVGRTVRLDDATTGSGCLSIGGLASDLAGTELAILPLPRELSPSALPAE